MSSERFDEFQQNLQEKLIKWLKNKALHSSYSIFF